MIRASLLGLVVNGVLLAESAILLHLETVRVILLVLHSVVVSLLALRTSHGDFHAHNGTSLKNCLPVWPRPVKFRRGEITVPPPGAEKGAQKKPFSQVEPF